MTEENKNFETYIRQDSGYWKVGFSVGVQSFELDYDAESKEQAEWMQKKCRKGLHIACVVCSTCLTTKI